MAILVLFEHFTGKLFKSFDPNFEYFTEYDAYCSHIFNYASLGVRFIVIEEARNYGKIVFIKNIVEKGW